MLQYLVKHIVTWCILILLLLLVTSVKFTNDHICNICYNLKIQMKCSLLLVPICYVKLTCQVFNIKHLHLIFCSESAAPTQKVACWEVWVDLCDLKYFDIDWLLFWISGRGYVMIGAGLWEETVWKRPLKILHVK